MCYCEASFGSHILGFNDFIGQCCGAFHLAEHIRSCGENGADQSVGNSCGFVLFSGYLPEPQVMGQTLTAEIAKKNMSFEKAQLHSESDRKPQAQFFKAQCVTSAGGHAAYCLSCNVNDKYHFSS